MALKTITGNENITMKSYKMSRFNEVKDHLEDIQEIDVNEAFLDFYKALKEDAAYVIKEEERAKREFPNNQTKQNEIISNARAFSKSTEVRRKLFYTLKQNTDDFRGKVYDSSKKKKVEEFKIPEKEKEVINKVNTKVEVNSKERIDDESLVENTIDENVAAENVLEKDEEALKENELTSENDIEGN